MSKDLVCTLFERDYHLGVVALINSLSAAGFDGDLVAGYRGLPPSWSYGGEKFEVKSSDGLRSFTVCLVPVETENHLTNYKPDFLLQYCLQGAETVWYMDPDIVVTARWSFFREWANCGIALCEDINAYRSAAHPRRVAWRRYFETRGFNLRFRCGTYVNGGAIGLNVKDAEFLKTWSGLQTAMAGVLGGLNESKLSGGTSERMRDPLFPFNASDQDALNAALEVCDEMPLSILGRDAMGFEPGHAILPHALGTPKPWSKNYIAEAICGKPPSVADKEYWRHATGPVNAFSHARVKSTRLQIKIAALLGRFYRRS